MGRIAREVMYMQMARVASQRSTCHRLNVGAIVTYQNSPISVGWNGAPSGQPHCAGNLCPGINPGGCPALHAEHNALDKAETLLSFGKRVDLYVTHSPCEDCTLRIMDSPLSVNRIFFEVPYRKDSHLVEFKQSYGAGRFTEVYMITPAGYIVEYFSRKVVELPQ